MFSMITSSISFLFSFLALFLGDCLTLEKQSVVNKATDSEENRQNITYTVSVILSTVVSELLRGL